ncbi:hypothetical protein KIW84_032401 [Lathyrus oleraceus]|uniref:Uncharacterized protein n=1 Tax=Pisum sativum TaxID=3888 RepID=A0A9D5AYM8_PEA|nr:hypothetical protein KIW84_032401 [Pisum sativum]
MVFLLQQENEEQMEKGNYCSVQQSTRTVPQAWEKRKVAKRKALTEAINFQQFNAIEIIGKISGLYKDHFDTPYTLPKLGVIAISDFCVAKAVPAQKIDQDNNFIQVYKELGKHLEIQVMVITRRTNLKTISRN